MPEDKFQISKCGNYKYRCKNMCYKNCDGGQECQGLKRFIRLNPVQPDAQYLEISKCILCLNLVYMYIFCLYSLCYFIETEVAEYSASDPVVQQQRSPLVEITPGQSVVSGSSGNGQNTVVFVNRKFYINN